MYSPTTGSRLPGQSRARIIDRDEARGPPCAWASYSSSLPYTSVFNRTFIGRPPSTVHHTADYRLEALAGLLPGLAPGLSMEHLTRDGIDCATSSKQLKDMLQVA